MTTTRRHNAAPRTIDLDTILNLYRVHADALGAARDAQRILLTTNREMRPKLDDIEAELTYLTKAWTGEEPIDKASTELAQAMDTLLAKE